MPHEPNGDQSVNSGDSFDGASLARVDELVGLVSALDAEAAALQREVRACSQRPTVTAINKLQALVGELELASRLARHIASDLHHHVSLPGVTCCTTDERLSAREREVLGLLARGVTVSEIAKRNALSVKTVSTYRTRALRKLGFGTTAQLMRYGVTHAADRPPLGV